MRLNPDLDDCSSGFLNRTTIPESYYVYVRGGERDGWREGQAYMHAVVRTL